MADFTQPQAIYAQGVSVPTDAIIMVSCFQFKDWARVYRLNEVWDEDGDLCEMVQRFDYNIRLTAYHYPLTWNHPSGFACVCASGLYLLPVASMKLPTPTATEFGVFDYVSEYSSVSDEVFKHASRAYNPLLQVVWGIDKGRDND